MQENSPNDQDHNLLNLYFNAWKDHFLSRKMEYRAEIAALVHYSFNIKFRFFLLWQASNDANRKLRQALVTIKAKRNLILKKTVFRGIDIILKRKDTETLFKYKLVMMYIKRLYRKSLESWREYHAKAIEKNEIKYAALLLWKENMLKKYFWLLKNWKTIMPDKKQLQEEYANRTRILWKRIVMLRLRKNVEYEQAKEIKLKELIKGEWEKKQQVNAKRRVIRTLIKVVQEKEAYYRHFIEKLSLKRAFKVWKNRFLMNIKHFEIIKKFKKKLLAKYFTKLVHYKDECGTKKERNTKARKFYMRKTRVRLFGTWRKEYLWSEKTRNIEDHLTFKHERGLKLSIFKLWRELIRKQIAVKEALALFQTKRLRETLYKLLENAHRGKKLDEMNRKARRFQYYRKLRVGLEGLKANLAQQRNKKIEQVKEASSMEKYRLFKLLRSWKNVVENRIEKKQRLKQAEKFNNDKIKRVIFGGWKKYLGYRREKRLVQMKSERYFAWQTLSRVMRRWKIFNSIRKEKVHYGQELDRTVKLCLAMRRLRTRTFQLKQDRIQIQQNFRKLHLTRKRAQFIEFAKITFSMIQTRKLQMDAARFYIFYLKKKAFMGFIQNQHRTRREKKMMNVALDQWCYYRYKQIFGKFRKYMEIEHQKSEEEAQALEMRKEHLRKAVFSKLLAKGLELRTREFKKHVKKRIMDDMKEYTLMRKYAMRWLDFYYKRTGKTTSQPRLNISPLKSFKNGPLKSSPLKLQDLESRSVVKTKGPKSFAEKIPKSVTQTTTIRQPRRDNSNSFNEEKKLKENDVQRDNKIVDPRLNRTNRDERKPSAEKQILDWFADKHVNKEKRQPKRLPSATRNDQINNNNRLLTSNMSNSLFGQSRMDYGRVPTPTQGTNFLRDHSPEVNRVLNEQITEEELNQKAEMLRKSLLEIQKNKDRLSILKQRNSIDDQTEIKTLTGVIEAQKKEAKSLRDEIRNTTQVLGTSNISLLI